MKQISEVVWELPPENGGVPVKVYASEILLKNMQRDRTLLQARNVAKLPNVLPCVSVMPDGHEGYGFPIGGVAAFPAESGIVSPGGIGYDINCGVRLLKTNLVFEDIKSELPSLVNEIFKEVPCGLGSEGRLNLTKKDFIEISTSGLKWSVDNGYAKKSETKFVEEKGSMETTHSNLSQKSISRGIKQIGTLGAGNHFVEIQRVESTFSPIAEKFGLSENQIVIMVHTGSRGFGHQIASEHITSLFPKQKKFGFNINEKELVAAPLNSKEGQEYLSSMKCAVNFAFTNRQVISHFVERIFEKKFGETFSLLYDVTHNIGKFEKHGENVFVHRKGATRAFGPGRKEIPLKYQKTGQPVLIPGSMGTSSYVLFGKGNKDTFESSCHGAGRILSRSKAKKSFDRQEIKTKLKKQGIFVKSKSSSTLSEEAPRAYKDVDEVVKVIEKANICGLVARLKPLGVVKG